MRWLHDLAGDKMHRLIGTVFLIALASCGGGDATTAPVDIVGVWTLRTVSGKAVPAVLSQTADTKVEVLDAALTFSAGGAFSRTAHLRTSADGQIATDAAANSGTYTVSGTDVSLTYKDGVSDFGTLSGSSLTLGNGGTPFVYVK